VFHWGKMIGLGLGWFTTGDVPGVLIGFGLGYVIDNCVTSLKGSHASGIDATNLANVHKEFFNATFTVMGYIDQLVPRAEQHIYDALTKVTVRLKLPDDVYPEAVELYNAGMSPDCNLNRVILPFYAVCHTQKNLMETFLEIQLYAAYDGDSLDPDKYAVLLDICYALELTQQDFDRILGTIQAEYEFYWGQHLANTPRPEGAVNLEDAYDLLNVSPSASIEEIKKAYRRQTNLHHPDKLIGKGLPEDMLKLAEDKTHEIRMAYERIRALRNF